MVAYSLLTQQPLFRFPKYFRRKIIDVAEVNWQRWLEESGQWFETVDRTRLVLASANPNTTKRSLFTFSASRESWTSTRTTWSTGRSATASTTARCPTSSRPCSGTHFWDLRLKSGLSTGNLSSFVWDLNHGYREKLLYHDDPVVLADWKTAISMIEKMTLFIYSSTQAPAKTGDVENAATPHSSSHHIRLKLLSTYCKSGYLKGLAIAACRVRSMIDISYVVSYKVSMVASTSPNQQIKWRENVKHFFHKLTTF